MKKYIIIVIISIITSISGLAQENDCEVYKEILIQQEDELIKSYIEKRISYDSNDFIGVPEVLIAISSKKREINEGILLRSASYPIFDSLYIKHIAGKPFTDSIINCEFDSLDCRYSSFNKTSLNKMEPFFLWDNIIEDYRVQLFLEIIFSDVIYVDTYAVVYTITNQDIGFFNSSVFILEKVNDKWKIVEEIIYP